MAFVDTGGLLRLSTHPHESLSVANHVLDAAGESVACIGHVMLAGRSGSKTISAAGSGSIVFATGISVTFANAGTTARIGIQDVDGTTGLEDGSYDVYGEHIGGGGGIAANTVNGTTMSSGSKTLNQGDIVAVIIELTARAGADTIQIRGNNTSPVSGINLPYASIDSGSGPAKQGSPVPFMIIFDDGTYGWIEPVPLFGGSGRVDSFLFGTGNSPDEYAAVVALPFPCKISAVGWPPSALGSGDGLELIIYTSPLTSPSAAVTITVDPDIARATGQGDVPRWVSLTTPFTMERATAYGFAVRVTAGTVAFSYFNLGASYVGTKTATPFTTNMVTGRTDATGAFTEIDDQYLPILYLNVSALDDGTGNGEAGYQMGVI